MTPRSNGDLSASFDIAKAAWARCAAEVDVIAACQAKTQPTEPAHE